MTGRRCNLYLASVIGLIIVIGYLHYSTTPGSRLQEVYVQFHYIPVLVAALAFGLRGAVLVSAVLILLYLPFMPAIWSEEWLFRIEHSMHILFPVLFGLLTGFLVDLERRQRTELEKARYLAGLGQAGATLVHDLKNPLLSIIAFARRLEQGKGDINATARRISEAAGRIEQMGASVLSFAKPIALKTAETHIGAFLDDMCEKEKIHADEHGVRLKVVLSQSNIRASLDTEFMERALLNILANAVEASKEGQEVTVSAEKLKNRVTIMVADRGAGMDRDTLENLFIPFYSKKTKGTGLGMAIAKKIVEEHGGMIRVASEEGVGSQVLISLPCEEADRRPINRDGAITGVCADGREMQGLRSEEGKAK